MKLWGALYGMIWLVFLEFLLAMIPLQQWLLLPAHYAVGFLVIAIAYSNFTALRATTAPGRIKRIAQATFSLAVLMLFLGTLLAFNAGATWIIPIVGTSVYHAILFFHILNAFAIITQAAAVAIAFDMWEDKEFELLTSPGEVPAAPLPNAVRPVPGASGGLGTPASQAAPAGDRLPSPP